MSPWFKKPSHSPRGRSRRAKVYCATCGADRAWGYLEWVSSGARLSALGRTLPDIGRGVTAKEKDRVLLCPQGHPIVAVAGRSLRTYAVVAAAAAGKSEIVRELNWGTIPDPDGGPLVLKWKSNAATLRREWTGGDEGATRKSANEITSRAVVQTLTLCNDEQLNEFLRSTGAVVPEAAVGQGDFYDDEFQRWGGTIWPMVHDLELERTSDFLSRECTVAVFDLAGELADDAIRRHGWRDDAVPGEVRSFLFVCDGAVLTEKALSEAQLGASSRPDESSTQPLSDRVEQRRNKLREQIQGLFEAEAGDIAVVVLSKADTIRCALSYARGKGFSGLEAWAVCFGAEPEQESIVARVGRQVLEGAVSALRYLSSKRPTEFAEVLKHDMPDKSARFSEEALEDLAGGVLTVLADPATFWKVLIEEAGRSVEHIEFPDTTTLGLVHPLSIPRFDEEFRNSVMGAARLTARDLVSACVVGAAINLHGRSVGNFGGRELRFAVHCAREVIDEAGNTIQGRSATYDSRNCTRRLLQLLLDDALRY